MPCRDLPARRLQPDVERHRLTRPMLPAAFCVRGSVLSSSFAAPVADAAPSGWSVDAAASAARTVSAAGSGTAGNFGDHSHRSWRFPGPREGGTRIGVSSVTSSTCVTSEAFVVGAVQKIHPASGIRMAGGQMSSRYCSRRRIP